MRLRRLVEAATGIKVLDPNRTADFNGHQEEFDKVINATEPKTVNDNAEKERERTK